MYWLKMLSMACIAVAAPAAAQDDDVTLGSSIAPVFSGGELLGCSAVFDVAHRDHAYRRGELVLLSGSLSFYAFPGKAPAINVKLGVAPLGPANPKFEAPAAVFLISGMETNKKDQLSVLPAETPGFRMFGFEAGDATLESVMEIVKSGQLKLGYAMATDGIQSIVDVDFTIKRFDVEKPEASEVDDGAPASWGDCIMKASEKSLRELKDNH